MTPDKRTVIVIGAGASGMVAALTAARRGAHVTLLERQDRIGRKLLATGNGRCNLSNTATSASRYRTAHPAAVQQVLDNFTVADTLAMFKSIGLLTQQDEQGLVYPLTNQSSTVLDVLRLELVRSGVTVITSSEVRGIKQSSSGTFLLECTQGPLSAAAVIVCAGGKAAPQLGGCGRGLELLAQHGHPLTHCSPALSALPSGHRWCRHLKGIRVRAAARLVRGADTLGMQEGEIQFTDSGLSGIAVFQLSLETAVAPPTPGISSLIELDLFPGYTHTQLCQLLSQRFDSRADLDLETNLLGVAHKRIVQVILEQAGLDKSIGVGAFTAGQISSLAGAFKGWQFPVEPARSWHDAQVMAGGAALDHFDPVTLESLHVKRLYAAGELLDVTGECGGFNLQWAWSSGASAGAAAAERAA